MNRDPATTLQEPLPSDKHEQAPVESAYDWAEVGARDWPSDDLTAVLLRHCTPDNNKLALLCNGKRLHYAELAESVEALARRLVPSGVERNQLIGVCAPRSLEMVVAMLAILRCGAAYVPLDPAFPIDRLRYMVQHAGLSTILVDTVARGSALFGEEVRLLELTAECGKDLPAVPVTRIPSSAPAYVIYTSGSTGHPKGVAVPRGAVVNFLRSMLIRPGIGASDTVCAITTLSFDIAVLELLGPLAVGGSVVIATDEQARDPRPLIELLRENPITLLQATPVTWQMLLATEWKGDPGLTALCGGEPLSLSLARALLPKVKALWNMYGPTETTVWSTCGRVRAPEQGISVGFPIANTELYILDDNRRPVSTGDEGRLFIAGAGVAIGYLNDEAQTSARFVADPFRGTGKMYDTGDRARMAENGELVVLGRSDHQVKLRGFRIELGEIEACLGTVEGLEEVACIVRQDEPNPPELCAYFTLKPGAVEPTITALRHHCGAKLPLHMVPSRFQRLEAFPRTPNRKLDRTALPRPSQPAAATASVTALPRSELESSLLMICCKVLGVASVGVHDNFFELGGTSLTAFRAALEIEKQFDVEMPVLKLFEYPTVSLLAQSLKDRVTDSRSIRDAYRRAQQRRSRAKTSTEFDVAIIGAAGRFPGAKDLDELWRNLSEGRESVTTFTRDELDPLVLERDRNDPHYVPKRGVLSDSDQFDAALFGISPNEAELMSPQLRVFLEIAWEAFENAGYVGENIDGLVGVWAGMGNNFYYLYNVLSRPNKLELMGEIAAEIGNEKDHIAPRVSHKLNLTGPSLSVHTACSTTLVVIENAYQALVSHQVDVALAGGVDIRTPQKSGQRYEEGGIFSIDGHCRPFDAEATGTMFGEGAGAVILKRLDDALRDRDQILAVIKGAAVNHEGSQKVSYLAPSVEGQARVIATALGLADIDPATISFVEAHGTATPIGDPIEVEALSRAYRLFTEARGYCALGSIKGNFGHATTAAGIAGVLKVILALRHKQIPPTLHFRNPNPRIDFGASPFFVNNQLMDWQPRGTTRRAAVSSFGFCGTNAHILLQEAPATPQPSSQPSRKPQLFLLSARSPEALDEAAAKLSSYVRDLDATALADAAYTTQVGRKRFEYRRCVVAADANEAARYLVQPAGPRSFSRSSESVNPPVAFAFPGQGSQYVNMGLQLYASEQPFRAALDRCATALVPHLGCDLRTFLFPAPGDAIKAEQSLRNTYYTQPAIFSIAYAMATLLGTWGIHPSTFIGHSIGEFVAATLAGVLTLEDALRLVAARGKMMQQLPSGSMLSVRLPVDEVRELLPAGIDVAAVNAPRLCVVSGPEPEIDLVREKLAAMGANSRLLHTSHAFHSSMMHPIVEPFLELVRSVPLSAPRIPFVSTLTGSWIQANEATSPEYWARHLRSTVQFSSAVQLLLSDPEQILLEVGPGRTSTTLALQHQLMNPDRVVATMPDSGDPEQDQACLMLAIGALWLNGCNPNWDSLHRDEVRRRIALPSYPFQRQRYWLEPGNVAYLSARVAAGAPGNAPTEEPAGGARAAHGTQPDTTHAGIRSRVVTLVEELLGRRLPTLESQARFITLGLDSLLLTQFARAIRSRLGFEVTFRQLSEEYSTTQLLVDAIAKANASDAEFPQTHATAAATTVSARETAEPAPMPQVRQTPHAPMIDARLGRDERGEPAWFVPDPNRPGKYVKVLSHG